MKIWTSEHIFNHSWETVTQAAWRKYPNPMNPAVVGIDVISRHVEGGRLISDRLISSKWGIPGWAASLIGSPNVCYGYEKSTVDPAARQMELKTRNLTFGSKISVDERLVYSPHPEDPSKTLLRQEAVVTVQGVPLTSYMEGILTSTISANANKGREAMEWVIGKINQEMHELAAATTSVVKTTDELISTAKHSVEDIAEKARQLGHLTDNMKVNAPNIGHIGETASQRPL